MSGTYLFLNLKWTTWLKKKPDVKCKYLNNNHDLNMLYLTMHHNKKKLNNVSNINLCKKHYT